MSAIFHWILYKYYVFVRWHVFCGDVVTAYQYDCTQKFLSLHGQVVDLNFLNKIITRL